MKSFLSSRARLSPGAKSIHVVTITVHVSLASHHSHPPLSLHWLLISACVKFSPTGTYIQPLLSFCNLWPGSKPRLHSPPGVGHPGRDSRAVEINNKCNPASFDSLRYAKQGPGDKISQVLKSLNSAFFNNILNNYIFRIGVTGPWFSAPQL